MNLKIMFLGGVGEIGKNMTVFEYGDDIVILDAGISFPTSEMPGVDLVMPDITYLKENRQKIRALILTHGHEDHIGAVPFLVKDFTNLTIVGTKLTLALASNKLIEHGLLDKCKQVEVKDCEQLKFGVFNVEMIHVSHSVAGSMSVCLTTPVGVIFHTGDFKIDYTPLNGEIMNLSRIAEIGKRGVMLLMSESTNVEREGYTMSESVVSKTINRLFADNIKRRIIIATFSSNVDRLQDFFTIAKQYNRKVALSGRSMLRTVETAAEVGYLKYDKAQLVDINKIDKIPDENLLILSTGSQGEPMSALTRMADSVSSTVVVGKNDTIILSSSPIPGNERDIYRVINNLYKLGAEVVYSQMEGVHVSGHACKEELKLIYTLIHPKYFIPVHGEYRHLKQHALMVEKLGHKPKNIFIPEIGDFVEFEKDRLVKKGKVPAGYMLIDGLGVGDVGTSLIKDRLALSEEGIIVVVMSISGGSIVSGPEALSRGCIYTGDNSGNEALERIKELTRTAVNALDLNTAEIGAIKTAVVKELRKYFKKTFQRFPMILPVVMLLDRVSTNDAVDHDQLRVEEYVDLDGVVEDKPKQLPNRNTNSTNQQNHQRKKGNDKPKQTAQKPNVTQSKPNAQKQTTQKKPNKSAKTASGTNQVKSNTQESVAQQKQGSSQRNNYYRQNNDKKRVGGDNDKQKSSNSAVKKDDGVRS